ncbi:MAG: arginyl-tRNA synthetase [Bacteroides sp. SM23_62_1]|nr:MAG: arginyl-tRNA synthetase [Bacteroides sp. SM23_62_1]
MESFIDILGERITKAIEEFYQSGDMSSSIQLQRTRKEFKGDITLVVFPLLRLSKKSPEETGLEIATCLKEKIPEIRNYNIVKGFLNIELDTYFWKDVLSGFFKNEITDFLSKNGKIFVVEYSSPNTNKPLHLGHIRNNLIGFSISRILQSSGHKVIKVNIVNDRGIHICKSMLAWMKWGQGETPESAGTKGDHLVGDYYVKFEQEYKKQVDALVESGVDREQAMKEAPLIQEAQELLRKWEINDTETWALWEKMNGWVYDGFDETYKALGVDFDKIYYESETYKLGRSIVLEGVKNGVFQKREDGSVWADMRDQGLDQKVLLRSDGTSVYITQDLGTAHERYQDYHFDKHIYVVGNEQNYHFQMLIKLLDKMGFPWAHNLYHLSYGMVELPSGKMKSREGTVVDADDLIEEMIRTARTMSQELGKLDDYTSEEKENIFRIIGLGALKYFILKVDPKKNMLFDPVESVDFNGNTGPFIQYTYTRICSLSRKAKEQSLEPFLSDNIIPVEKEVELIKLISQYPETVESAGNELNPSLIANYVYELAKEYNQYYHDFSILSAETEEIRKYRLLLSRVVGNIIESGMWLLGIEVPERM